jgi:hypothetical protein
VIPEQEKRDNDAARAYRVVTDPHEAPTLHQGRQRLVGAGCPGRRRLLHKPCGPDQAGLAAVPWAGKSDLGESVVSFSQSRCPRSNPPTACDASRSLS